MKDFRRSHSSARISHLAGISEVVSRVVRTGGGVSPRELSESYNILDGLILGKKEFWRQPTLINKITILNYCDPLKKQFHVPFQCDERRRLELLQFIQLGHSTGILGKSKVTNLNN